MIRRLRTALAPEDFFLVGWAAVAQPLIFSAGAGTAPDADIFAAPGNVLLGTLYVLASVGAVIALLTRDAGAEPRRVDERDLGLLGPTAAGIMLVFVAGFDLLGAGVPEWLIGLVFVAAIVGGVAHNRLPALTAPVRRTAVTPFVMAAAGLFDQAAVTILGFVDLRVLDTIRTREDLVFVVTLGAIILILSGVFYAMLVLAPRRLAGDREGRLVWVIRYTAFVLSAVIGAALGGALLRS